MKHLFPFAAILLLLSFNAKAQQSLETRRSAESGGNCIFLGRTLCRAVKDKQVLSLAASQTAALLADGVTTTQYESRGYVEINPAASFLLGSRPTWQRMAPLGALQVVGQMWLAERLKTSRHQWIRKVWWLPLAVGITGNSTAATENSTLR